MQPIQWSDDFATGIKEIDAQHRQLVDMITSLETAKESDKFETTAQVLVQLNDYVHDHFSIEDQLMENGQFDPAFVSQHRGEHAHFRGAPKDFTVDFESRRSHLTAALIKYLGHWLLHHIMVSDQVMARQFHAAELKRAERTPGVGAELCARPA